MTLPKFRPAELIEELRLVAELNQDATPDIAVDDGLEWEASDMIEAMYGTLKNIAASSGAGAQLAREFLSRAERSPSPE